MPDEAIGVENIPVFKGGCTGPAGKALGAGDAVAAITAEVTGAVPESAVGRTFPF